MSMPVIRPAPSTRRGDREHAAATPDVEHRATWRQRGPQRSQGTGRWSGGPRGRTWRRARCARPSRPGGSSNGSHAGTTTRSFSIHEAWAWARHVSVTDGSSSMTVPPPAGRERPRPHCGDRVRVVAERGPQLDQVVLRARSRRPAPRWRRPRAPTGRRHASSASLAGTVTTSPSTAECLADPAQALAGIAAPRRRRPGGHAAISSGRARPGLIWPARRPRERPPGRRCR